MTAGDPTPTRRVGPTTKWLLRAPTHLYDVGGGWMLGQRFLRLSHVGRRSGRTYHTVLEVVGRTAAGEYVVMAGLGQAADWLRNVRARPTVEITVGRRQFVAVHRTLEVAEAVAVLAGYERRNRLAAPVVRRVLSWLVGWAYDGSVGARERLVAQLPLVAFGPATTGSGQRAASP